MASRSSQRSERDNTFLTDAPLLLSLSRSVDGQQSNLSLRPKAPSSRRSVTPNSRTRSADDDPEPGRVRVAVRLRPRNAEDLLSEADFADCVELQPELKRLKLKKNNWSSESFRFDEVFSESASQRRVYEAVAKPVVESVLTGYNGTVMAYGQTGTGKTYTLGRLGEDDASERGIMVRAMEDIIANTSQASDSVEISYLQTPVPPSPVLPTPTSHLIHITGKPKPQIPLDECSYCHQKGHWKHSCPNQGRIYPSFCHDYYSLRYFSSYYFSEVPDCPPPPATFSLPSLILQLPSIGEELKFHLVNWDKVCSLVEVGGGGSRRKLEWPIEWGFGRPYEEDGRILKTFICQSSKQGCRVWSLLQLYLECIQDLLAPEKTNIPIVEEPKTGEVALPGAMVVKIRDLDHFLQLLQTGEENRHAANTKLNSESSRSHAILMVQVWRSVHEEEKDAPFQEKDSKRDLSNCYGIPIVRKSKLLIVDLAGSERLDKSGSEGRLAEEAKFINLSLTSLGKCINALAENSPHIPIRDSKLTRLLRDSFGGSARTSLIVTIGPSSRHHTETTSTIMFGQRAMKVVNTVKLKEEFDYESLCRKLENRVEHLTAEIDRQQKLRDNDRIEMERNLRECQKSFGEAEKSLVTRSEFLENENSRLEIELKELGRLKDLNDLMQDEVARLELSLNHSKQYQLESSTYQKVLADTTQMYERRK
ncbi:armadillo/beta-catenin repeat family protein [Actinidia rufa]|uniref:Kinesin-like protein n=1 Tax=Actinidia rufa TaxID=165716 RepID=A0A7J0GV27_9ERIC|nr:armadillo/beta-catenin repeat family protein [Actinidia rufa]